MSETLPQRPTFSNGQYIGADDLNAAVGYARDETERSVLSGRTWGIATGLALIEIADATGATQMFIEPGIAWDGYGRPVVVIAPAPVTADLFSGLPAGNQIVWLTYQASPTQMIAPGFQTCGGGDPATRVAETYQIVTGAQNVTQRTAGVTINGVTVPDPRNMLIAVNTGAAVVLDGSAPQQIFPDDSAQWLIPIGVVAYTPGSGGASGSFSPRSATQLAQSRIVRRSMNAVAESVLAADGVLRLRDRQTDQPTDSKGNIIGVGNDTLEAQASIQLTDIVQDPNNSSRMIGNELVWVEGNMRVTGNARMFGTRLELRDSKGQETGGASLFLRRGTLAAGNTQGGQDLQISIGGTSFTAGMDRLAIGTLGTTDATHPDGVLNEVVVVRTDAKAAIGTNAIDSYSTLANALVIAGPTDTGLTVVSGPTNTGNLFFADGMSAAQQKDGFVSYDHKAGQLTLGAGSNATVVFSKAGQLVLGGVDPSKLKSDADQLVVADPNGGAAGITIEGGTNTTARIDFANGTLSPDAGFIAYDLSANRMEFGTATTGRVFITSSGWLGIGSSSPGNILHVGSPADTRSLHIDTYAMQARDGSTPSPLILQPAGNNLGVGTYSPNATLHLHGGGSGTVLTVDQVAGSATATSLTAGNGAVGIGFAGTPRTTLDVRASLASTSVTPNDPGNYVAVVENTSNGPGNVLALSTQADFGSLIDCNLLAFFNGAGNPLGAVETQFDGVSYTALWVPYYSADYAEAVPRVSGTDPIGPGRIVGVRGGQASKETDGAEAVFVITDRPAILGNAPPKDKRQDYEMLSFIGQVQVLVDGAVEAGDFIAASGKSDGVGRPVPLDAVQPEDLPLLVGRAWASTDGRKPTRVNALVGPGIADTAAIAAILVRQGAEIERQREALERQSVELERQGRELARLIELLEELREEGA